MGWRFYRRVRVLPGVELNLGKRGASVLLGERGAHVTFGRSGVRETIEPLSGTGLYYTHLSLAGAGRRASLAPA
jgi:hypothetical protein